MIGKWYVFGGYDGPNMSRGIPCMTPNRLWSDRKNMLVAARHAAAVALDSKIYVFGGFVGRPAARRQPIECALYDPDNDSWKELAPMPAHAARPSRWPSIRFM